jgi:hypothetical protein
MARFPIAALIAVSVLGGLGAADYQAPVAGDVARIKFVNQMGSEARVLLYDDATQCRNRSMLQPVLAPNASSDTTVAAGRDLAFTMDMQNATVYCISTRSFRPVAGKSYVMYFQETARGCDILSFEDQRRLDVTKRKWIRSWGDSGPFCEALK